MTLDSFRPFAKLLYLHSFQYQKETEKRPTLLQLANNGLAGWVKVTNPKVFVVVHILKIYLRFGRCSMLRNNPNGIRSSCIEKKKIFQT